MITAIENEANDLLQGASKATSTSTELLKLQSMPEVSYALSKILDVHGQNPTRVITCAFLLGAYMGLQYHDIQKIIGE